MLLSLIVGRERNRNSGSIDAQLHQVSGEAARIQQAQHSGRVRPAILSSPIAHNSSLRELPDEFGLARVFNSSLVGFHITIFRRE